jgi:hypothetical protein
VRVLCLYVCARMRVEPGSRLWFEQCMSLLVTSNFCPANETKLSDFFVYDLFFSRPCTKTYSISSFLQNNYLRAFFTKQ